MARFVAGHWISEQQWKNLITGQVTKKRTPGSSSIRVSRRRREKPHYVDARGRWVAKPGSTGVNVGDDTDTGFGFDEGSGDIDYADLERRAHALAASQLAARQAAIARAQAAARAQADRDAATYQALGSAQMGMISKIPANIQGIRNTAGSAISSFANQVSGAAAGQLSAEHAAAANFEASQTGMAPTAPGLAAVPPPPPATALPGSAPDGAAPVAGPGPAPTEPGVPAPGPGPAVAAGPGPAPGAEPGKAIGLNTQAALAASAQMGGKIPASQQAEIGAASAMAAEGMPAVVARATQDQVAMRMAQAATEDADYRQQLIDLAAEEGGIYETAYSNLVDVETKKFGLSEANARLKLDQEQFAWKQQMDVQGLSMDKQKLALQKRAQLASEVLSKLKTKAQADKEMRDYLLNVRKVDQGDTRLQIAKGHLTVAQTNAQIAKQNLQLKNKKAQADAQKAINEGARIDAAASRVAGHLVNRGGNDILNDKGQTIPVAKGAAGAPKAGVTTATTMARGYRGTPFKIVKVPATKDNPSGQKKVLIPPKVSWRSAIDQIESALVDKGYSRKLAHQYAVKAVNTAYGPGVGGRPGVYKG